MPPVDPDRDAATRFLVEGTGVRGVLVRLERSWSRIRGQAEYPPPIASLLGECCAAAALFGAHLKVAGRTSVQIRGDGAVRRVFAECSDAGDLRGIAQFEPPVPAGLGPGDLGAGAALAITLESRVPGRETPTRYQGLVELAAGRLADAFEAYFQRSEQLPTRMMLGVDAHSATAAGLLVQQTAGGHADPDGWARCAALLGTLDERELLATPAHRLLYQLFHEDGVRWLGSHPLRFACSCSRPRVLSMLAALGREEALAAAETGLAEIVCEFCNANYRVEREELEALFAPADHRLH